MLCSARDVVHTLGKHSTDLPGAMSLYPCFLEIGSCHVAQAAF